MKKSLLNTNPYLKNTPQREHALARNIESSSAIEGIWIKRDATIGRFIKDSSSEKATRVILKKAR